MIIEHHCFRLADGVSEANFLDADRRVQTEFAPFCTGFVRRTTARGTDGDWLVETLWFASENADQAATADDGAVVALRDCIDTSTASVRRYSTLE